MIQTKELKQPTFGIGIALLGILLSMILGFISLVYYESADHTYKSILGNEGLNAATDYFKGALDCMKAMTYAAMAFSLCACGWGLFMLAKLRKQLGNNASVASIMMMSTFGLFALGTVLTLSSPIGVSFLAEIGKEIGLGVPQDMIFLSIFMFIIGSVLWVIGARKISGLYPDYKKIYQSALVMAAGAVCVLLALMMKKILLMLVTAVGLVYAAWCWIKFGKGSNVQIAASETKASAPAVVETPAPAPQPVPAPAPAKVERRAPAKTATPAEESAAKKSQSRTLIIVVCVASVIIIGLLCALLFKSGDAKAAKSDKPTDNIENVESTESIITPASNLIEEGEYTLTGTIAGKQVYGEVYINSYGVIQGAYCYGTSASNDMIRLQGSYDADTNKLIVGEYYGSEQTGEWSLTYESPNHLTGTILNARGRTYQMDLTMEAQ